MAFWQGYYSHLHNTEIHTWSYWHLPVQHDYPHVIIRIWAPVLPRCFGVMYSFITLVHLFVWVMTIIWKSTEFTIHWHKISSRSIQYIFKTRGRVLPVNYYHIPHFPGARVFEWHFSFRIYWSSHSQISVSLNLHQKYFSSLLLSRQFEIKSPCLTTTILTT